MLEAPQRRVDGAGRAAGDVDDLEAEAVAAGDRLQDEVAVSVIRILCRKRI